MRFSTPLLLATALGAPGALAGALQAHQRAAAAQATCNGHRELCHRRYSDVTFVGAHDSPFVGRTAADNQNVPVAEQLAVGVRFLEGQAHRVGGAIKMCHTSCDLRDAGPLRDLLAAVKTFLDANRGEVVTLLLTNDDGITSAAFGDVFRGVGLDRYAFAADPKLKLDEWPTLGRMIETGKRLVVFVDYPRPSPSVPYILNEFNHFVETPFEYDDVKDLSICPIDRPPGGNPQDRMLLMNHWLQLNMSGILIPRRCDAVTTNSKDSILRHAEACQTTLQKKPSFVLLDWIDIGDAMLVQDTLNDVEPIPRATRPNKKLDHCDDDDDDDDDDDLFTTKGR